MTTRLEVCTGVLHALRQETDDFVDRTSELRKKGYVGRRLGPKQMTTDTAVRVTRLVVHEKSECEKV